MKFKSAVGLALLACVPAWAAAADPMDVLSAYQGTWKLQIQHVDSQYSKAAVDNQTLRNECWRSSDYYACHQFVDGKSVGMIVFTYDPKSATYTSTPIPPDGRHAGFSGELDIHGKEWIFPWEEQDSGRAVFVRIINTFTDPDHIDYRQEFSTDQEHWTLMAHGEEVRVGS